MKITKLLFSMAVVSLFVCVQASADTVVYSTSFENNETAFPFSIGGLDQNFVGGANASANGTGGNPFVGWGPTATNANNNVIGISTGGIVPHTGSQQVCGDTVNHPGHDYINLTYRIGHGQKLTGNFACDWWVRDPNGKDSTNLCRDFVVLGNYDLPSDTDFTATGGALSSSNLQILALGMWNAGGSADYGAYQARILGPYANYGTNLPAQSGWWNLPCHRSPAWHHMRILVGPLLADNTNTVAFFVDDMDHAGLVSNTAIGCGGFNVLDFQTYRNYDANHQSDSTAYYDDVSVTKVDSGCTIEGVKDAKVGDLVSADGVYITAVGGNLPADVAYVQTANRSSSVRIRYSNPNDANITDVNAAHYPNIAAMNFAVGTKICAMGRLQVTADGEKYIDAYNVYPVKGFTPIKDSTGKITGYTPYTIVTPQKPVGMNNRDAASALAQGKYVKTWGKVGNITADSFTITDGSPQPIKVVSGTLSKPADGSTVAVTGVIGKDASGVVIYPGIQDDIVTQ